MENPEICKVSSINIIYNPLQKCYNLRITGIIDKGFISTYFEWDEIIIDGIIYNRYDKLVNTNPKNTVPSEIEFKEETIIMHLFLPYGVLYSKRYSFEFDKLDFIENIKNGLADDYKKSKKFANDKKVHALYKCNESIFLHGHNELLLAMIAKEL